ncbi:MAG: isocitrate/isopropylmalate family dehydrogenase [Planctomycetota bacterium]
MADSRRLKPPAKGTPIGTNADGSFHIPDDPIIPYIEGDGVGRDIWRASVRVFDAAVQRLFGDARRIEWYPLPAGETCKAAGLGDEAYGGYISEETFAAIRQYRVAIKGPLTTPVGGGIRSLNVMLRQKLELYCGYRPVFWMDGMPSPLRRPDLVNLHLFRETTEDVYAGFEWRSGSEGARKLIEQVNREIVPLEGDPTSRLLPDDSGVGIKVVSPAGCARVQRMALQWALANPHPDPTRNSLTWVHKGNLMKWTEGLFKQTGYALAASGFRAQTVSERESWILGNLEAGVNGPLENARTIEPGFDQMPADAQAAVVQEVNDAMTLQPTHGDGKWKRMLLVKDRLADTFFQQVLTRPQDFYAVCAMNQNGDYISELAAAQTGGLGMAPGANIGDGMIVAETTHGSAPRYADKDVINPGSMILSGAIMFDWLGKEWASCGRMIREAVKSTIRSGVVTFDLHRSMVEEGRQDARKVKCSEWADEVIANLRAE